MTLIRNKDKTLRQERQERRRDGETESQRAGEMRVPKIASI
jgi:hypothetical protein